MAQRRILDLTEASAPKDDMYVPVDHGNDGTQRVSIDTLLRDKANKDGFYETMGVGTADQLNSSVAVEDQNPYIYRQTGDGKSVGDRAYDKLVGGSVVWNQLASLDFTSPKTVNGITFTANADGSLSITGTATGRVDSNRLFKRFLTTTGHKYLMNISAPLGFLFFRDTAGGLGTTRTSTVVNCTTGGNAFLYFDSVAESSESINISKLYVNIIDLTAAVTPTIADYIYSLETATAGAGVAWFKKYFPGVYFAFCEPHFEHVQTSAKCTVGFNQFDKNASGVQTGKYLDANGAVKSLAGVSLTDYIPVIGGTSYYWTQTASASVARYWWWFDENKVPISGDNTRLAAVRVAPSNACYLRVSVSSDYWDEFNVNIHGDRDGEYEPYRKRTYPIEPKVLRGILKLDSANRLYFDGDIYRHDGSGEQRYYEADLGSLNWVASTNFFYAILPKDAKVNTYNIANTAGYQRCIQPNGSDIANGTTDKAIGVASTGVGGAKNRVYVRDTTYTDANAFKTAMSGKYLLFDLDVPEPFTAEPFQSPMVVDPLGTEEFVDYGVAEGTRDVAVPVGHVTEYPADLRGKVEHLPSLASADGRYCIQQTGTQMALVADTSPGRLTALEAKIPDPPTTDGTYTLKAVVVDGSPTFSWVSE